MWRVCSTLIFFVEDSTVAAEESSTKKINVEHTLHILTSPVIKTTTVHSAWDEDSYCQGTAPKSWCTTGHMSVFNSKRGTVDKCATKLIFQQYSYCNGGRVDCDLALHSLDFIHKLRNSQYIINVRVDLAAGIN